MPDRQVGGCAPFGGSRDLLSIALDHWTASDGRLEPVSHLDEAFAVFQPLTAGDAFFYWIVAGRRSWIW
ncbi:hypothetical protein MCAG_00838 [Micromonospora sp. ATCC 39149]|nr:hypothetical protein MCAG_00838 [Micromonospora sp. ATCC 39149]